MEQDRVYLAGPLFTQAERSQMEELDVAMRGAGFETFLPHRDGLEFARVKPLLIGRGYSPVQADAFLNSAIFALDTFQVMVNCGSLVINASGRVPDEGAVSEAAMAYALGKPIVYLKFEDPRSLLGGADNPLVAGVGRFRTANTPQDAVEVMKKSIEELAPDRFRTVECSPHVGLMLSAGEELWRALKSKSLAAIGGTERLELVCDLIVRQFGAEVSPPLVEQSPQTARPFSADPQVSPRLVEKKIYFAGALFNHKDLSGNLLLAEAIRQSSEGRYGCLLPQNIKFQEFNPIAMRDACLSSLLEADGAIFNFDGAELDSGTVVEFMYAKLLDLPTVVLRTDFRNGGDQQEQGEPWNLMCSGYPRSKSVVADAMSLYQESMEGGVSLADAQSRFYAKLAQRLVAALDEVCSQEPGSTAERTERFRLAIQMPGASLRAALGGDDKIGSLLNRR
ncbi:MAG: nucleoside 2-deoxyribosyltransferase [Oligoflexia bacterium]|nr:nucleoside 2-deoxyribosyltransferase [Oligoflexia bacterium]